METQIDNQRCKQVRGKRLPVVHIVQIGGMLHTEFLLKIFALATCSFVVTLRYFLKYILLPYLSKIVIVHKKKKKTFFFFLYLKHFTKIKI